MSQKSNSFSRLVKKSLRSCADLTFLTQTQDTETTKDKTIHVDFLQLLQKTPNEIALKRSYSASYKQDPVSSSTQQHKKNIRENRKTTEVPPDNAGTRADGIMEQ